MYRMNILARVAMVGAAVLIVVAMVRWLAGI